MKSTNGTRLERWLGREKCEEISQNMKSWYGPPIALCGVPGAVFATGDGDFVGEVRAGFEMTYMDHAEDLLKRLKRAARVASSPRRAQLNAGFASLSDLISEITVGGKRQDLWFNKVGTAGVVNATNSLWAVGTLPPAGANGSAAPGGRACTSATVGAFNYQNPTGGDTAHIISTISVTNVASQNLLLYDRLFDVAKTMNSTATEAVTGVPTRYQNTSLTAPDSIAGNFLFVECTTVLPATAHNWTVCTYQDQANAASTLPSLTGNSGNIVNRIDHPTGQWFAPLETGDVGIRNLTQMQCSAAVATGTINFVIGHPLAWMLNPVANQITIIDGINTAFNLVRIFDNACLSLLAPLQGSATATTFNGQLVTASG